MKHILLLFILIFYTNAQANSLKEDLEAIYNIKLKYEKEKILLKQLEEKKDIESIDNISQLRSNIERERVKIKLQQVTDNYIQLSKKGITEQLDYFIKIYSNLFDKEISHEYVDVINYVKINNTYYVDVNKYKFDSSISKLRKEIKNIKQYKLNIEQLRALKGISNVSFVKKELDKLVNNRNYNEESISSINSELNNDVALKRLIFKDNNILNYTNQVKITFYKNKLKIETM